MDVEPTLIRELPAVDDVRIWLASLDQTNGVLRRMAALLSDDEIARIGELKGVARRNRFFVARGVLRLLLGEATGTAPERIAFDYGRDGKPSIAKGNASSEPHFNVSHSRDLALVAIAGDRRTGIDIEWTEGSAPYEGVAKRFLSPAEQAVLAAAPPGECRRAFYRIWVRKEAYLKGRGEGISEWIYDTDFSRLPEGEEVPAHSGAGARDQDRWIVRDVDGLPQGFVASVAVERSGR